MKKNQEKYEGKTGIAVTRGFEKKGLAELAVNIGNVCEFDCAFCYVPSITNKQAVVQMHLKLGLAVEEFSLYRSRQNVLDCIERDLKKNHT